MGSNPPSGLRSRDGALHSDRHVRVQVSFADAPSAQREKPMTSIDEQSSLAPPLSLLLWFYSNQPWQMVSMSSNENSYAN